MTKSIGNKFKHLSLMRKEQTREVTKLMMIINIMTKNRTYDFRAFLILVDDKTTDVASTYCRILNVADGASLPAVQLKDGSTVQTGTVAAMLKNIQRFNNGENQEGDEARYELERCVPVLLKVGLFQLFTPDEWINNNGRQDNPGRKFVGQLAKQYLIEQ
uniref:DUF7709 domain-containing protein n=1 Tax=Adineta vaga TaxID=104782 RepID=B3G4M6_ADIVA|nr:hypothetical protein [Adineta vaga]